MFGRFERHWPEASPGDWFTRTLSGSLLIDCCVVMKVTAQAKSKYTCALNFVVRPILQAHPAAKTAAI
ncbi:hypothetical protein BKM03_18215 [Pseudomonas avellanae]|uniref:Uncharacterized protein n=1 Tax=Pseudomonas avellanae TaxID=46257 RepID=A0AAD0DWV5_9PSED|nr:hypothetical protein BKM03_18215 [Pseudomonas avellanae]POP86557.1 hypothetical protein CXB34_11710 [Pseudomonas amygdali pv. morsprunorum]